MSHRRAAANCSNVRTRSPIRCSGDVVATIAHHVGVDPEARVPGHTNRSTHISHGGKPIKAIL